MKMSSRIASSILHSLFIMAPVMIYAQQQTPSGAAPANSPVCSQELFEQAETSFRGRRFGGSEMLGRAERELRAFVQGCADTPWSYKAHKYLKVAQEEWGNHTLEIALFYRNKFQEGKSSTLTAARGRLEAIIERCPQYSRTDKVLSLLGEVNMTTGDLDRASSNYRRLVNDFPGSQYAGDAYQQLNAIEVLKADTSRQKP